MTIATTVEEVWRAIVDPALGPRWMGMRIVCDWQLGGAVALVDTPLGPDYAERGTLLGFEPGRVLRYDHWSPLWRVPDAPGNRAIVSLELEPIGTRTRVSFRHELPVVEALAEHSDFFWRVGLAQLKELVERLMSLPRGL